MSLSHRLDSLHILTEMIPLQELRLYLIPHFVVKVYVRFIVISKEVSANIILNFEQPCGDNTTEEKSPTRLEKYMIVSDNCLCVISIAPLHAQDCYGALLSEVVTFMFEQ